MIGLKRWRITFTDGTSELTPESVDWVIAGKDAVLRLYSTRTYSPDELVAIYPLSSIRKWEQISE